MDNLTGGIGGVAKSYRDALNNAQCCVQEASPRPYSLREEMEKNSAYHAEQAQKLSAASDFLRDHPEFEAFIRLIRSGAIQL